jgi:pimeloyl-ACP methyl ester carboxylesterase
MLARTLLLALLVFAAATRAAEYDPISQDTPNIDPEYPPAISELAIPSAGQTMAGLLYQANGAGPHPTVVLLHGLPGNEKNLDIAQVLRRAGFNVLFFQYRGAWGSQGSYALTQLADDALAVLTWLRDPANARSYRIDPTRLSTLGHSAGGFASLAIGSRDQGLACVGAMAPANFGLIAAGIRANDPASLEFLAYADSLFMLEGFNGKSMRRELMAAAPETIDTTTFGAGLRGKSVLMVVGKEDNVTPSALMFDPVVAAYRQQSGLQLSSHKISGDHSFSATRLQLTRLILDWMLRDCR